MEAVSPSVPPRKAPQVCSTCWSKPSLDFAGSPANPIIIIWVIIIDQIFWSSHLLSSHLIHWANVIIIFWVIIINQIFWSLHLLSCHLSHWANIIIIPVVTNQRYFYLTNFLKFSSFVISPEPLSCSLFCFPCWSGWSVVWSDSWRPRPTIYCCDKPASQPALVLV